MHFVLHYDGPLPTANSVDVKLRIQRHLHPQIRRLWEVEAVLNSFATDVAYDHGPDGQKRTLLGKYIDTFKRGNFKFVPLVTQELGLRCALEIVLYEVNPNSILSNGGDIDNRIKVLIDSLRIPEEKWLISKGCPKQPGIDEEPFYILLEDDKLVVSLSTRSSRLLDIPEHVLKETEQVISSWVKAQITVAVRPVDVTLNNLWFLGGWF